MRKPNCSQILAGIVGLIGAYMVLSYGGLNPPTLSGLAFILIASALWRK